MNAPLLRLNRLAKQTERPSVEWALDCPTPGVVIVDVTVGESMTSTPLHWRAGDWTKPPLDVRLRHDGLLESIQFVLQDESVDLIDLELPSDVEIGLPLFDVEEWPSSRYSDARAEVLTARLASGALYAAIGDARPVRSIAVHEGLRLDFGTSDQLSGIAVGPLTREDWETLKAAAP